MAGDYFYIQDLLQNLSQNEFLYGRCSQKHRNSQNPEYFVCITRGYYTNIILHIFWKPIYIFTITTMTFPEYIYRSHNFIKSFKKSLLKWYYVCHANAINFLWKSLLAIWPLFLSGLSHVIVFTAFPHTSLPFLNYKIFHSCFYTTMSAMQAKFPFDK